MSKKEAIVDTCFFNKLSNDGKNSEVLKKVLTDLDYKPVVHPYIAEKELDMFPHFNKLVEEGFIRKAEYSEFIEDEYDKNFFDFLLSNKEYLSNKKFYYENKNKIITQIPLGDVDKQSIGLLMIRFDKDKQKFSYLPRYEYKGDINIKSDIKNKEEIEKKEIIIR